MYIKCLYGHLHIDAYKCYMRYVYVISMREEGSNFEVMSDGRWFESVRFALHARKNTSPALS